MSDFVFSVVFLWLVGAAGPWMEQELLCFSLVCRWIVCLRPTGGSPAMWVAVVDVYVFVCGCWRFPCGLSNNRGFQALKFPSC